MEESQTQPPRMAALRRRSRTGSVRRGITVLALTMLAAAMPVAAAGAADATPDEKAQAIVNPSIVFITGSLEYYINTGQSGYGYFGPLQLEWSCTGFYVNPTGYVATAGHCVDYGPGSHLANDAITSAVQDAYDSGDIDEATANALLDEGLGLWTLEGESGGSDPNLTVAVSTPVGVSGEQASTSKNARVVESVKFEEGDIALLKVEESNAPALLLADDDDIDVGIDVLAAGYPASESAAIDPSQTATFKDGKINKKGTSGGLKVPVYETSAALSPGMSGGPTVDMEGKAVGVNSSGLVDETAFNFISPISLIKEQLARNGVKNELGPADKAYQAGLTAYFAGDYTKAITHFDKALGLRPSNYYAQDFKKKANEKLAEAPPTTVKPASSDGDSSGGGSALLIGALVLAVLVIGGLVFVVARKGKGSNPEPPTTPGFGSAPPAPGTGFGTPGTAPAPPGGEMTAPGGGTATTVAAPPPPADSTGSCRNCGDTLAPGARFCPGCGQAV